MSGHDKEIKKDADTSDGSAERQSAAEKSREKAGRDSLEGLPALVETHKSYVVRIKAGVSTGITRDFGKPLLIGRRSYEIKVPDKSTTEHKSDHKADQKTDRGADQSTGHKTEHKTDQKAIDRAAEIIRAATKRDNFIDTGTDEKTIYAALQSLHSKQDREALKATYEKRYNTNLEKELKGEMSGAELDKALRLLDRPEGRADDAGSIHALLVERGQLIMGRNNDIIEGELRTRLATMNSRETEALKAEYKQRFQQDISAVLKNDPHLSDATKECVSVYLKGTDKRTPADVMQLADIALKNRDIDLFRDVFVHASPEARKEFADNKGEERMRAAFEGSPGNLMLYSTLVGFLLQPNITDRELDRARDYARQGRLDTANRIKSDSSFLGDNEAGIEQTLRTMSTSEREKYIWGRELSRGQSDQKNWSSEDKAAVSYYNGVHHALTKAGNETEVARWEDMIAHQGGTLISKLAEQRGMFGRHDTDNVLALLENVGRDDWERLKADPDYRSDVRAAMKTFLSKEEMERAEKILDRKLNADQTTFEQTKDAGRRSLLETLNDNVHWYGNDKRRMVDAIKQLTPEELRRLRTDDAYSRELTAQVAKALGSGPELDEAHYLLRKIAHGEAPTSDIVTRTYEHAAKVDTDEGQVVADLQKALRDAPGLRQRILEPATEADKQLRKDLEKALHRALDPDEYRVHIEPLFQSGDVSLVSHIELDRGLIRGNMERFFEGLANSSERDRKMLLAPEDVGKDGKTTETTLFQQKVFGELSSEEKEVARHVLSQRQIKTEDSMRLFIVASTKDAAALKETLSQLSAENRQSATNEYVRKYGSDPTHALLSKLEGEDRQAFSTLLPRSDAGSRQLFSEALEQYGDSRSGRVGRAFVENLWDGTGLNLDDAMKRYARGIEQTAKRFEELPPEKQKQLGENLGRALTLYKESKEQAADAAVDGVLAAGSVAAAPFTSGVSLGYLVVAAGTAGAVLKVTGKALIAGSDHDWSAGQLATDIATGFANGMASVIGPAEVAKALSLGSRAAAAAAERSVAKISVPGIQHTLKPEARELLTRGTSDMVRSALVNGENRVSNVSLLNLADSLVLPAIEESARKRAVLEIAESIRHSLGESIAQEARTEARHALKRIALNAEAGVAGGTVSGVGTAIEGWDPDRTIGQNLEASGATVLRSAAIGGAGALAFSATAEAAAGAKRMRQAQDAKAGTSLDMSVKSGWYREDPQAPMLDYLPERRVKLQAKEYTLQARESNSKWFYTKPRDQDVGPVKVIVSVKDTADLGRIQEILIPQFENRDSALGKLVADYRTLDPRYGAGQWDKQEWAQLPASERGTTGFQIAVSSPEDAAALQKKIDQLLGPGSGRTSLVREHFDPAIDNQGNSFGARLDQSLSDAIHKRFELPPDAQLSPDQLRTIEKEAGLKEGILTVDRNGDVALSDLDKTGRPKGGLRIAIDTAGGEYPLDYYLPGSQADASGELTSRAAYASLSKKYCNQDPVELLLKK